MNEQEFRREEYLSKPLPSSRDAERTLIGNVFVDNEFISTLISMLAVDDFYTPMHRTIYAAMIALYERGLNIDPIMVGEEIKKTQSVESIGGIATISAFLIGIPDNFKADDLIDVVKQKSIARKALKRLSAIQDKFMSEEYDSVELLDEAERELYELRPNHTKEGLTPLGIEVQKSLALVTERAKSKETTMLGLPTGFRDFDEMTSGLQKTDLIIIAGRSSMGKTSCALNFCLNASELLAEKVKPVIAIFSLEMSKQQLANRMLCQAAKVDATRYRNSWLTRDEWGRIAEASDKLAGYKIEIDDSASLNTLELKGKARKLATEQKRLDLIVVDYLQLMSGVKRSESREKEVAGISRELKALAKELDVPVVALSQLSRAPETRGATKHRPMMSDLRESGGIENDADIVGLIYREEYYGKTEENQGIAELIIAKNRQGRTGTVKLAFLSEFSTFENFFGDYN